MPTALERQGDFSQSVDNNGNPYPYIRDPQTGLPCCASNTSGCFQDGGVLDGSIPANRLYAPGMALLNMVQQQPTMTQAPATNYNVEDYSPTLKTLSYQPATRVDYQVASKLRVAFKMNAMNQNSGLPDQYGAVSGQDRRGNPRSLQFQGNQAPWITTYSMSGNYNIGSKYVPGSDLRAHAELLRVRLHVQVFESLRCRAGGASRHLHHQPGRQSRLLYGRRRCRRSRRRSTSTAGSRCRSRSGMAPGRGTLRARPSIPGGSTSIRRGTSRQA